ncbi:MAG: UGSC family (seleno)protein, partial [Burkholderiales bacterium]
MAQSQVQIQSESVEGLLARAYEHAYEEGWTDGLPIIPATPGSVQQFVAASGRAAEELIGLLPPRKGRATVEAIAVNTVMAGCRPEYMPVIIAAVEGMLDPNYPLEFMQVTTNPMTPFLLVNGPVRKRLDINCGTGCLGPGWRANATIGRAIRLIMNNIGGALPGVYSKVSFGSPLRYSYICGENEEENPWTPFHVDRGFQREESAVTVFKASNFCTISGGEGVGPEEILRQIATNMPPMYG